MARPLRIQYPEAVYHVMAWRLRIEVAGGIDYTSVLDRQLWV